jgi:hypothetical protein
MNAAAQAINNPMLDLALGYAGQRWPVFPCNPSTKQPYTAKGFKAATMAVDQIVKWWTQHPDAMIGVPTGSASGFWALDIDVKPDANGEIALAKLEATNGPLPVTMTASTPSGGTHYYFQHAAGVGNRSGFEPGIDVRGEGGYVIVPGSMRHDGCYYAFTEAQEPSIAPAWLLALVVKPKTNSPKANASGSNPVYSEAAINNELQKLMGTNKNRNNQLNDSAMAIGQFVGRGDISRRDAEDRLFGAATANGYVTKDGAAAARATIKSGLDAGEQQPRAVPEPTFQLDDDRVRENAEWTIAWIAKIKAKAANDNKESKPSAEDDTIDAETLLGMDFPPLSYVIPGYVVEGLTILGGKPKMGKSWWSYDAGIAVATGGRAMGSVRCEQGDVIYLALEDNRRRMKERILILAPSPRKQLGISLSRLSVRTVAPRIDNGLMAELDKWRLSCQNPRLIIIDVYMKVRPPRKRGEDVYAADYAAVVPLQKYASEHRLAIVLVTHTRKMEADDPLEQISGTNGVTGAADAVLVLTRGKGGTTLYGRGRDIEEIETAMQFDGGKWSILGDADEVRKSSERRKIIAALKEAHDELTPKAIADLVGMKAANVRVLLRKMVADGDICQPRVGFYSGPPHRPGDTFR